MMFAGLMQSAAPALAEPPQTPKSVITAPAWISRATGNDLANVYPSAAMRRGLEGIVMVVCRAGADGSMVDCAVEQEAPGGQGFGDAALKLMPKFHMRPMTRDGQAVAGGTIRLPIQFRLPR